MVFFLVAAVQPQILLIFLILRDNNNLRLTSFLCMYRWDSNLYQKRRKNIKILKEKKSKNEWDEDGLFFIWCFPFFNLNPLFARIISYYIQFNGPLLHEHITALQPQYIIHFLTAQIYHIIQLFNHYSHSKNRVVTVTDNVILYTY